MPAISNSFRTGTMFQVDGRFRLSRGPDTYLSDSTFEQVALWVFIDVSQVRGPRILSVTSTRLNTKLLQHVQEPYFPNHNKALQIPRNKSPYRQRAVPPIPRYCHPRYPTPTARDLHPHIHSSLIEHIIRTTLTPNSYQITTGTGE